MTISQKPGQPGLPSGTRILGRFRIDRLLGIGGMGTVYAVWDEVYQTRAAVKVMAGEVRASEVYRRRLLREAEAASLVAHPNVVRIYEVLTRRDGSPVIVMELLDGASLSELLAKQDRLSLEVTSCILLQVVSATGAAHAQGVIHRDLKPGNIFLVKGAKPPLVKVLDFGIAKVVEETEVESQRLTARGQILGTIGYMSPEQAFGEAIDYRTDIWSLGVLLYRALAGCGPVASEGLAQMLQFLVTCQLKPLHEVAPEVPGDVSELVGRMLARYRQQRPELYEVTQVLQRYASVTVPDFGLPVTEAPLANEIPTIAFTRRS